MIQKQSATHMYLSLYIAFGMPTCRFFQDDPCLLLLSLVLDFGCHFFLIPTLFKFQQTQATITNFDDSCVGEPLRTCENMFVHHKP